MSAINILDISVANLIAAGEVVERPANAVKELTENAIDAGAHKITVEIQRGGIALMRVTDDGCGMSDEDAVKSIKRHATSKIRTKDDLGAIFTLGFRGEALAAISAVTKMRIMTKRECDKEGVILSCDYGASPSVTSSGCPNGTTVICESLFANTPARLKFLKSDAAEEAGAQNEIERIAVSHPDISFKFVSDGEMKFQTPGNGSTYDAIYAVYGKVFATSTIEIGADSGGISVSGYVTMPMYSRGNRGMQVFFVNGRSIRSKLISAAIDRAYESYLPVKKYPSCVLNIGVNTSSVDVNIHPSKLEVKFSDEKSVFNAIFYTVRGALDRSINRPTFDINDKLPDVSDMNVISAFVPLTDKNDANPEQLTISTVVPTAKEEPIKAKSMGEDIYHTLDSTADKLRVAAERLYKDDPDVAPQLADTSSPWYIAGVNDAAAERAGLDISCGARPLIDISADGNSGKDALSVYDVLKHMAPLPDPYFEELKRQVANELPRYSIAGEIFNCYLIVELEKKILIVDKHAAHERINFEILKSNYKAEKPNIQLLLTPVEIELSAEEAVSLHDFNDEITKVGFEYTVENGRTVKLTGIPAGYDMRNAFDMFLEMMYSVMDYGTLDVNRAASFEKALYQTACKMSIKAGRSYPDEHLEWICNNLLRYDCIKYCPHGRPVAFELTKRELDTRFGRKK